MISINQIQQNNLVYTQMYLSDFNNESSILYKFDLSPRDRSLSNKRNNPNGIAPWGTGDKILGNLPSSMKVSKQNQKNNSILSQSQFEHGNSLNLIEIPQKARTNRSTLGKFQKTNKNIKINQQYHLHMNKIQFRQQDRKKELLNQNQLFFKANPKINIKDFTSLDNNFFIRSYFFPNNIKTPKRKEETESLEKKKKNQENVKEIQTSTFLAIKSVDIKEKALKNQKIIAEPNYPLKNEELYEKYKTISVMSFGRKQRKKMVQQLHKNYQLKRSYVQVKKHNETIESTKQSSKQNCESFRQKNRVIVKETAKKDKLSQSGETIAIQPSFIRSPFDEHFLRIEQPLISTNKKINPSKEKHLVIAGIKKLKLKNDQHIITQFIQPKSNLRPKYSTIEHNYSSRQSDRCYKKAYTQTQKKVFQTNKNHSYRIMAYDRQTQQDTATCHELNKSAFLLNDTKEKTFILK